MATKSLKNNTKSKLSAHINAYDFRCKCGKSHKIKINTSLISLLEKLFTELDAKSITIYSGYRCKAHDKKVGGSGKGSHTKGQAVDCYFIGKNGKRIASKKVCLTLEDMGHKKGIGYRCGGGLDEKGQTHIDVANRKWYGDESKKAYRTKSCCSSYYTYFGIKKAPKYTTGVYEVISPRYVRKGAGTEFQIKKYQDLTNNDRKNAVKQKKNADAQYKKGVRFIAQQIVTAKNKSVWAKTPSGYVCIESSKKTIYCKKIK